MSQPLFEPEQVSPSEPDADASTRGSDDAYVSEFLSEESSELKAVRRAVTEARPLPGADRTDRGDAEAPVIAPAGFSSPAVEKARAIPWGWLVAVIAVAVGTTGYTVSRGRLGSAAPSPTTQGTATIVSRPAGAQVLIDGVVRGVTPLRLSLPVGSYAVELKNGTASRTLTVMVEAATATREVVDLAPGVGVGRLEVTTDVPGARVSVDGVARGLTPLVLEDLEPRTYVVAVAAAGGVVNRTVHVLAGATASVAAVTPPAGSAGGFLTITAPIEMQIIERGQVIGTTGAERMMLPAGRHELELVAAPFEFRTTVTADVAVGRTVSIPVAVPEGRVSINALPWAEVWIDNRPLGSTPLANIAVPIGMHEVVWRHPQLGERRQSVRVTAETPTRVGMDLNR
jgi:PEGA domain